MGNKRQKTETKTIINKITYSIFATHNKINRQTTDRD